MKPVNLSLLLLLALSSSASAMGGGSNATTAGLTLQQIGAMASSMGPTHTSHLVQSRASCAPDAADPVWGPNNELLGFSCYLPGGG